MDGAVDGAVGEWSRGDSGAVRGYEEVGDRAEGIELRDGAAEWVGGQKEEWNNGEMEQRGWRMWWSKEGMM